MRRFSMVLATAVATAMITVAVVAIDSVGAETPGAQAQETIVARFADCMRDRGMAVPALRGAALERWLKRADLPEADARACKTALADVVDKAGSVHAGADAAKLAGCLRAHGLEVPDDPFDLKRWIAEHRGRATEQALKECGLAPAPSCGEAKDEAKLDEKAKLDEEATPSE